jgi:hypothetical protein
MYNVVTNNERIITDFLGDLFIFLLHIQPAAKSLAMITQCDEDGWELDNIAR